MNQPRNHCAPADSAIARIDQHRIRRISLGAVLILVLSVVASIATGESVKPVGQMTFADANTLIIADWRAGQIHALHLAPVATVTVKPSTVRSV